jgi:hypothetical protein
VLEAVGSAFGRAAIGLTVVTLTGGILFGENGPVVEMAGRTVRLSLMRIDDRTPAPWPSGDCRLTTKIVTGVEGSEIAAHIVSGGILPDSAAYSLVYDLNPGISNLDRAGSSGRVVIPVLEGCSTVLGEIRGGSHLVAMMVDPGSWEELDQSIGRLRAAGEAFIAASWDRFSMPSRQGVILKEIENVLAWFEDIRRAAQRRKAPPTSRATLIWLNDEAGALGSLLLEANKRQRKLNAEDEHQIAAIHTDLELEIRRYDDIMSVTVPPRDLPACCYIEARILGAADGQQLKRLRIYSTLDGLYRQPPGTPVGSTPFRELGSSRSELLQPKIYKVWVAPEGEPGKQLTKAAYEVKINPSEKLTKVELLLKSPGAP